MLVYQRVLDPPKWSSSNVVVHRQPSAVLKGVLGWDLSLLRQHQLCHHLGAVNATTEKLGFGLVGWTGAIQKKIEGPKKRGQQKKTNFHPHPWKTKRKIHVYNVSCYISCEIFNFLHHVSLKKTGKISPENARPSEPKVRVTPSWAMNFLQTTPPDTTQIRPY